LIDAARSRKGLSLSEPPAVKRCVVERNHVVSLEWKLHCGWVEEQFSLSQPGLKKHGRLVARTPLESARDARLSYVTDQQPGFSRVTNGKGFRYYDAAGRLIRKDKLLRRIQLLVIPPAWRDVWICANRLGHLQATGRDARNRKQYLYHPRYRSVREESKYDKLLAFGMALPRIRKKVRRDLSLPGMPAEKVVAAVVRLMDLVQIRVGNDEYARQNQSYGLTTMRDRHVKIKGSQLHFQFKGKSGKLHEIDLQDQKLAAIVKRCRDLPGYELFQYMDEHGGHVAIDSGMVNHYLCDITGEDITAKDFRTWHGTVQAAQQLGACGAPSSKAEVKRNVVAAAKAVAGRLGNQAAVCRKHYIHPIVLELYEGGGLAGCMCAKVGRAPSNGLSNCERCVLQILGAHGNDHRSCATHSPRPNVIA
jgi:DNA topoisomerase I